MSTTQLPPAELRFMKTISAEVDRWKAVRRGPIYCAPACGGGCTHAAFLKATADAAALCASLNKTSGKGWTPNVWENLGWHHSAISACGRIKVHPHGYGIKGATAFFGSADLPGGKWSAQSLSPAKAVQKVIAEFRAELAPMIGTFDELAGDTLKTLPGKRRLALTH